jgi:hypothetical protein
MRQKSTKQSSTSFALTMLKHQFETMRKKANLVEAQALKS